MRAHRQLLEAERLATLGTVATGLVHEINNPLAVVCADFAWWPRLGPGPSNARPAGETLMAIEL